MTKTQSAQWMPEPRLVQESVDRVEGAVLAGIRAHRSRRRRFRIGLAALSGIALFASGVAVGGAALAHAVSTGPGNGAVFTVDCYRGVGGHRTSSVSFTVLTVYNDVKTRPAEVCVSLANSSTEERQVEGKITRLNSHGLTCGFIDIKGGDRLYFDGEGWSESNNSELAVRPGCGALFAINAYSSQSLVACRVTGSRVAVYPLGKATAAVVCGRARLRVWK